MSLDALKTEYAQLPENDQRDFLIYALSVLEDEGVVFTEDDLMELERRAEEARSGKVKLHDLDEVLFPFPGHF